MIGPTTESALRPAPPLLLRTLGGAGLYSADGERLLLGPSKSLALLTYLALTPGRRISREFLVELLWADVPPERARNALRQALYQLRRLLDENALPGVEELTLTIAIEIDRDRFLSAVEKGDLDDAVERYTGHFLPEFAAPGGAAFERWADLERHRLQTAFLRSAELLVRRQLNESRVKDALRLARRVRDALPDVESAWRLVLEAVIAGRDFVAASVEADALENHAATDGYELEAPTRAVIARARQLTPGQRDDASDATLVADLTGREREFSIITAAWDAARAGHSRHLHLSAPAGLGKTRLLRDAAARLRAGGARVVEVRGAPGDRDIPYAFAGDLAMAIAALPGAAGIAPASASALVALNPALSSRLAATPDTAVADEAHRRRIQALGDLVQSVAYERPFALVIDDVHWIDLASYRVLEGLFGRLAGAPVLCLTAARPERTPIAEALTVLPLAPLTPAQVGSLVFALGAIPDDAPWGRAFVDGLHASTRGSPLLILESLRLALDEQILELGAAGWTCAAPDRLAALLQNAGALRRRVEALPENEAWVLALLAEAGTPLGGDALAAVLARPAAEIATVLASLERHGLVARAEHGWTPSHDELAEVARDALAPDRRASANRALGAIFAEGAGDDANRLLRGIRHFVAAGDDAAVRRHFRRYALLSRERHDARPFRELAADALGEPLTSARADILARSLPPAWRGGLWSARRQVIAAAAAIALASAGIVVRRVRAERAATTQSISYADADGGASVIEVDPAAWDGRTTPLLPVRAGTTMLDAARSFPEKSPAISPDARAVAWTKDSGDSTTLDIWIRTPAGTRRLTNVVRDDLVQGWAPDGSMIVGMTNRWTPPSAGNYDIAVFDTATGAARQITGGPPHDGSAAFSPDGTRIAFIREGADGPARLCVIPFDAIGDPECRAPGGHPVAELLGWSGAVEIILTVDSANTRYLVRYDWERDASTPLFGPHLYGGRLSPDRKWVLGSVPAVGERGFHDWIIPLDRPANARMVNRPASGPASVRWWEGRPDRSLLIDRIVFADTAPVIQPGVGTRLRVRALNAAGAEIPVHAPVRWNSSDTTVATVDALGVVHARRSGSVTIDASLAGWRRASTRLEVRETKTETVFEEGWDDAWRSRWIAFGDPRPTVVAGPGGVRGMWNSGDGTFQSFVVLRRAFDARAGLGLEVRISTPVTRDEWQRMRTVLVPGMDTLALQRGDQKKAPASIGRPDLGCSAGFPAMHGRAGRTHLAANLGVSDVVEVGPDSAALATGAWWTLRMQLFPDGRCGIAVNGRVVWISSGAVPLDAPFWIRLGDESAFATLLHGPLKIWTGVRTDVAWTAAPLSAPRRGLGQGTSPYGRR